MISQHDLHGKFRKSTFRYTLNDMQHLAISKLSPHAHRLLEIENIIRKMVRTRKVDDIIKNYLSGIDE